MGKFFKMITLFVCDHCEVSATRHSDKLPYGWKVVRNPKPQPTKSTPEEYQPYLYYCGFCKEKH